jgi:hypothetical protein
LWLRLSVWAEALQAALCAASEAKEALAREVCAAGAPLPTDDVASTNAAADSAPQQTCRRRARSPAPTVDEKDAPRRGMMSRTRRRCISSREAADAPATPPQPTFTFFFLVL